LGNKCLDVVDGVDGNGTKLQLWDCTPNNDNQRWVLQGGQLQWLGHSRCLDVTDGLVATDGTVMQIWDCTSYNDNQMWQLTSLPSEPNVASTGNEVVAGGNQVVAGGNQVVAGGNVVVPPVTYVAVDITHASSAFRAAIQAMVSQGDPTLCATVQGFPTAAVLGAQTCINAGSQHFIFDGNGRISYPSQNLSLNGVYYDKGSYCLGVGMAGKPTAGQPVLVPCNSGDNSQMWAQAGNVLVSLPNKTCLGFDPNGQSPSSIRLGACTTRPQYGWTLQN
jgi:hypothetical protein